MSKITPKVGLTGKYKVKAPWVINENLMLTCIAIRSFDDIYHKNEDVYDVYYEPYGAVIGNTVNGSIFDFDVERLQNPNIVTLSDVNGGVYYIPDTYIASMPTESDIPYSERILSISLGPTPDALSADFIINEVSDLVKAKTGMSTVVVQEHSLALLNNPSFDEHQTMERVRYASLQNGTSVYQDLAIALAEIRRLNALVSKYETTLTG